MRRGCLCRSKHWHEAGVKALRQAQQAKEDEEENEEGLLSGLLGLQQSIALGEDPSNSIESLVNLGADAGTIAQFSQLGMQQRENFLEEERRKAEATAFANRKKSLSSTATALGFDDLATRIEGITNKEDLKEIAKEIRKAEFDRQLSQTPYSENILLEM